MGKILTNYNNLSDKDQKKYEASIKQLYKIMFAGVIFYYVIPFVISIIVSSKEEEVFIYILFYVFPFYAFLACFLHSKNHGFTFMVPISVGLMFIPTVIIYRYDYQFAIFSIVYMVIGGFGGLTGYLMLRRKKKKAAPIGANYAVNKYARKRK